jgi:hypothetical protein
MARTIVTGTVVTGTIVTKSGVRLTEEDIERLADKLEAGIDLSKWTRLPVGRPPLEAGTDGHSPRIEVRVPPSLHRRVRARAAADGRTVSQIVRGLLEEYVKAG